MKNNKLTSSFGTALVFFLIWLCLLNMIFVIPELRRNKEHPRVQIHLNKPIFGASGFETGEIRWERIDECYAITRIEGLVSVTRHHQAYLSLKKSKIRDTKNNQHILSEQELCNLFTDLCDGRTQPSDLIFEMTSNVGKTFSIDGESQESFFLPHEFTMGVTGRYEGDIVMTTQFSISEDETDIDNVWKTIDHLPWITICVCFLISVSVALLVFAIVYKVNNLKICIICSGGITILIMLFLYAYSSRGNI